MHDIIVQGIKATQNLSGEVWECGTFQGDTAMGMRAALNDTHNNRIFRMFDTFTGQPFSGPYDSHRQGSMVGSNFYQLQERFKSEIISKLEKYTNSKAKDLEY